MKPGIYKLSMDDYLKAPGYSQSQLKLMGMSPAHFRYAVDHPEPSTEAQKIGSVLHTATLEPHLLDTCCWIRPETYEKKGETRKWNGNATECKDWLAAHEDRPVIRVTDYEMVMAMNLAVLEHESASVALAEGENEMCMFVNDPVTGLPLKCRSDRISGNTIIDLKSTLDASKDAFSKTILNYGYDQQAAFNLDMSKWLGIPKDYFLFIAVEKEPPYAVAMYELDRESIEIGRNKYRRWISLVDHCIKTNEWPGYDPDITRISLPEWSKRQLALSYDVNHLPMLTE